MTCYGLSEVEIPRDRAAIGPLGGFTRQPDEDMLAEQALTPRTEIGQALRLPRSE